MRLSGARPKRTWNIVVSSSTMASRPKVIAERLIEGARLVGDLGGVAGDRDQELPVVAEIDRRARPAAAVWSSGPST